MISTFAVGPAPASAVDSAGSSTLASSRGAARCGPATSGRSRHAPASANSATSTERLMRPLLRLWMERDRRGQNGCRRVAKRNYKSHVAKTHQHTGLGLRDQWNVTPNPKSTTFCFQPVANGGPPPDTLRSPTPPYTKLATGVRETLRPTRISYPRPAVNPQPVPSTEGLVFTLEVENPKPPV